MTSYWGKIAMRKVQYVIEQNYLVIYVMGASQTVT